MSISRVKRFFDEIGLGDRVRELEQSSATVELAAQAIGCEAGQIAKTLTFLVNKQPLMVVCAGNVKVSNPKFKARFHRRPSMIPAEKVRGLTGHEVGGVCPFVVKEGVAVYLDQSLKANRVVYPGAGNSHSLVELTLEELERLARPVAWIDVCQPIV
ncbi:MAG: YbaK/EbsC family protein [Clostridiaceae bacterium]|nr:YbaK/EbsC family protein [Clostridiaceae bacterium]